jgi:creatinine amidohydrolase
MDWLTITSERWAQTVEDCAGLCLLPMGCIERHGPHLAVGCDQLTVDAVARLAAEVEPAIVFPSYFFGKIWTARHYAGTFALGRNLLLDLLEATLDEIARNGLKKVLIVNGHGGNTAMLHFFLRSLLAEPRDYVAYATNSYEMDEATRQEWAGMVEAPGGEHADEGETSWFMHLRPDLVHMEDLSDPEDGRDRQTQKGLEGLANPAGWLGRFPTHYSGDARAATPEKGEFLVRAQVERLVRQMRAVKADDVTAGLLETFYRQSAGPQRGRQ